MELGPAGGAAQGLGVEAAICRIVVVALAGRTQRKGRQAGVDPLEGQLVEHAVAGAAIGATDQGVAVAPVGGVAQFGEAGQADGQIRADKRRCASWLAGGRSCDAKPWRLASGWAPLLLQGVDAAAGRQLLGQSGEEGLQPWPWALQHQFHPR